MFLSYQSRGLCLFSENITATPLQLSFSDGSENMLNRIAYILILPLFLFHGCSGKEVIDEPAVDTVPPVLISVAPKNNAENVSSEIDRIVLTFDKEIALASPHNIRLNNIVVFTPEVSGKEIRISIQLQKDTHYDLTIPKGKIRNTSGVALEEEITLSFRTEKPEVVQINENLVVSNPSPEAVKIYNFLRENYGQKIISGAMANVSWNAYEADWVYKHTGKYPALNCYDYIHLPWSPANWIDYSDIAPVKNWWNSGGIVAAGWHWIVPAAEGVTDLNSMTYEPAKTAFRAKNAVTEGTWENEVMKADLQKMAGYLKLLRDENIPVLWRPLHEAAGNIYEYNGGTAWFWWGYDGAEVFRQLWIYMFEYFESQGLNNLIWVWTSQTKDEPFYPGDDYVDIIGRDIYNKSSAKDIAGEFATLSAGYPGKMVTLSECGGVAAISDQWKQGAAWSWFMPWYDYERTNNPAGSAFNQVDHQFADIDFWKAAFDSEYVITKGQLPDFK